MKPEEILFKAKLKDWKTNPDHNRWIEGFYLHREETTYCFSEDYERFPVKTLHFIAKEYTTDWGLPNEFRLYEIDPNTLCQWTGLEDENKNKIWENDIVHSCNREYYQGYWEHSNTQVIEDICGSEIIPVFYAERIKVLGNKFDNPELLKKV